MDVVYLYLYILDRMMAIMTYGLGLGLVVEDKPIPKSELLYN